MHRAVRLQGFTLIELLTVIAIIAILTAILFPVAGTVREQARASDCLSKLHQLWVSANVYKQDEGDFPPALFGYAEGLRNDGTRLPWDPTDGSQTLVPADNIYYGFLYRELVKDVEQFRCPDNTNKNKAVAVLAHIPTSSSLPAVQSTDPSAPYYWPSGYSWIGNVLATKGCPTDTYGVIDCHTELPTTDPLYLKPRYYYAVDSYDIGPALDVNGQAILDSATNAPIYHRHYSTDWTGVTGAADLPEQLKYANPPDDKTILTYCTWHQAIAHTGSAPAISMGGTAKKLDLKQMISKTALIFAR